jgi:superfamily II DNA or RNA helicase
MCALTLRYDRGTVVVEGGPEIVGSLPGVLYDARTEQWRAPGRYYRAIVEELRRQEREYVDAARGWSTSGMGWRLRDTRTPRDYQRQAVDHWLRERRGVVVLPTGTGKTLVAILCIAAVDRPTLVVTPKIDLMIQWAQELERCLGVRVGLVGAGTCDYQPLTVTTYDSAYIHLERWANRYGLVVFDECHHLPGASYQEAAQAALAPFRLGLTATPQRSDGGENLLPELVGPIVYQLDIRDVAGEYLAPYQVQRLDVDLTESERLRYHHCRETYRRFVSEHGIALTSAEGFRRFMLVASRSPAGWQALRAYREQKRIIQRASEKFRLLEQLLQRHAQERILIFTADNATVYAVARQFLLPAITNQTKARERKEILERLQRGEYAALVTCQVLNEGVDVPAASVGIILGGTGSTTENVQRLGRILRKHGDKQAVLYEIVARGTVEEYVSARRRQHRAFQ